MKFSTLFNICLLTTSVAGKSHVAVNSGLNLKETDHRTSTGTRKFIIELEPGNRLGDVARQLQSKSRRNDTSSRPFDCSDIFSGLAIETDSENVDSLRQLDGVVNAWPVRALIKARVTKSAHFSPDAKLNYSMHQWTNVDKLHAQGIKGKGATVAVIDTGIDYRHKALGGCFGPGCKVAGGYDLVGPTWDTALEDKYPKIPDADPMDRDGHGTHVAGIIAADNDWLTGVAPDARLLIYKVFADNAFDTDEETVIQAFCDAYHAGADIITSSLGEANGFSDNPWALVSSRLVEKGVVIVNSAGNEGERGPFLASSGASGKGVLAVAAVNVTGIPSVNRTDPRYTPMPAYFTSWGPTNEILLKPDIGAPGHHVVSTVGNQSYDELSGTSMAAPYIAGIAALFIGEHGGRETWGPGFAKMLRDRIASSGHSLPWATMFDPLRNFTAPPFQVGTGLVDAWRVLHYTTDLEYEPFSLLDKVMFKPRWKVNITNSGEFAKRYSFVVEPAAGINILDEFFGVSLIYALKPVRMNPEVTLPGPVTLQPGETREVEFVFKMPNVDEDVLPLYSGKVWIESNSGERLSIPYGGAAYDTEKAFSRMFTSNPVITGNRNNYTWSFNVEKDRTDFIEIVATFSYACWHVRWDIFEPWWTENSWLYPPVVGKSGYIGSATTMRNTDSFWWFDPKVNNKNDTIPFPIMRQTRGFEPFWWFGKLANGTQIPPGNYTMRFAALRPYGNPKISSHWDVMYIPARNIQILPYNGTTSSTHNSTRVVNWTKGRVQRS